CATTRKITSGGWPLFEVIIACTYGVKSVTVAGGGGVAACWYTTFMPTASAVAEMTWTPDLPESLLSAMTAAVWPLAPPLPCSLSCALISSPHVLPAYFGGLPGGTRQPVKPKMKVIEESQ